jgi:putative flippase GtrA
MRADVGLARLLWGASDNVLIQAFRFIVVGLVAFAADFSLLMLAVEAWRWNYLAAAALAYTTGLTINYFLCVRWVFPRRRFQDQRAEFALFALIGITGLGLTELILWTGKEWIGLGIGPAKFAALVAVAVWNFVLRKLVLFSSDSCCAAREAAQET